MIISIFLVARKRVSLYNPNVGIFQHTHQNVAYDTYENNYHMVILKNCRLYLVTVVQQLLSHQIAS